MQNVIQSLPIWLIAVIGAWIAYRQMEISDIKLKHDLFDRRYRVFDATRQFLVNITVHANTTEEDMREFVIATGDSLFFFRNNIIFYLKEIQDCAANLGSINRAIDSYPVGDRARANAINAKAEHLLWLASQLTNLADKFRPALQLDRRTNITFIDPTHPLRTPHYPG